MAGPAGPTPSDALADWLRALLEERTRAVWELVTDYRGVTADEAVEPGAGDRFREALLALTEAEARARLVELHRGGHACRVEDVHVAATGDADWTRRSVEWSSRPCRTLRLLAMPYSGWAGWREEWSV